MFTRSVSCKWLFDYSKTLKDLKVIFFCATYIYGYKWVSNYTCLLTLWKSCTKNPWHQIVFDIKSSMTSDCPWRQIVHDMRMFMTSSQIVHDVRLSMTSDVRLFMTSDCPWRQIVHDVRSFMISDHPWRQVAKNLSWYCSSTPKVFVYDFLGYLIQVSGPSTVIAVQIACCCVFGGGLVSYILRSFVMTYCMCLPMKKRVKIVANQTGIQEETFLSVLKQELDLYVDMLESLDGFNHRQVISLP